jgi:hypothetical protein
MRSSLAKAKSSVGKTNDTNCANFHKLNSCVGGVLASMKERGKIYPRETEFFHKLHQLPRYGSQSGVLIGNHEGRIS